MSLNRVEITSSSLLNGCIESRRAERTQQQTLVRSTSVADPCAGRTQ
jgi:hypothetical protein